MQSVATPGKHSIEDVTRFLNVPAERVLKTLIAEGEDGGLVALVIRGDHELNAIKAEKLTGVGAPFRMADNVQIRKQLGCDIGSIGPVGLAIPLFVDRAAAVASDFVCGANENGKHLTGVNWGRDLPEPTVVDLRNVVDGDPSPDGKGALSIVRGIEVGHIFQLGDKYSSALQANVLDENGQSVITTMGCYGIGVSRVVAAAIEQNHDDAGIIWPRSIAPFELVICPINYNKSDEVKLAADEFYQACLDAGIDVLLDDRGLRPGAMFSDMELIGIPHRVVLSDSGLKEGLCEYRGRRDAESRDIEHRELLTFIKERPDG